MAEKKPRQKRGTGPGRPRMAEVRENMFKIRMTDDELARVQAKARLTGMEASTWARVVLLREAGQGDRSPI